MKAVSKNDSEFILETLKQGMHVDGRPLLERRKMTFAFGKEDGQVLLQIGNTVLYTTLATYLRNPFIEREREGMYKINVNLY